MMKTGGRLEVERFFINYHRKTKQIKWKKVTYDWKQANDVICRYFALL